MIKISTEAKKNKLKEGIKKLDKTIQSFVSFVEEINKKSINGGPTKEKKMGEKR